MAGRPGRPRTDIVSNSLEEIVLGGSWQPYASAGVLLAALLIDLGMGEVPTVVHPVVYIGRLIAWAERRMPAAGPAKQLLAGGVLAAMLPSGLFAARTLGCANLHPGRGSRLQ